MRCRLISGVKYYSTFSIVSEQVSISKSALCAGAGLTESIHISLCYMAQGWRPHAPRYLYNPLHIHPADHHGSSHRELFVAVVKPPAERIFLCKNISFFTVLLVPLKPSATIRSQVWCEGGCPSVPCMSSHCSKPEHQSKWRFFFRISAFIFLRLLG